MSNFARVAVPRLSSTSCCCPITTLLSATTTHTHCPHTRCADVAKHSRAIFKSPSPPARDDDSSSCTPAPSSTLALRRPTSVVSFSRARAHLPLASRCHVAPCVLCTRLCSAVSSRAWWSSTHARRSTPRRREDARRARRRHSSLGPTLASSRLARVLRDERAFARRASCVACSAAAAAAGVRPSSVVPVLAGPDDEDSKPRWPLRRSARATRPAGYSQLRALTRHGTEAMGGTRRARARAAGPCTEERAG